MRQFRRRDRGFTLLELMLALSLGVMVFGVLLNLIAGDLRLGGAMATRLRDSARQRRTLELIRDELALGQGRMLEPPVSDQWPCAMAGRRPVLAIATEAGDPQARRRAIVYSVGRAPSAIWRGRVLMRCGPAYNLEGLPSLDAAYQNRVVLDALPDDAAAGFAVSPDPELPVLQLELEQSLPGRDGAARRLRTAMAA